jgi:hypothetical protein
MTTNIAPYMVPCNACGISHSLAPCATAIQFVAAPDLGAGAHLGMPIAPRVVTEPTEASAIFVSVPNPLAAERQAERQASADADRADLAARELAEGTAYAATAERRNRLVWAEAINRQFRDNYRPEASPDAAEFWRAIADRTAGDNEAGFKGWTRSVLVSHAGEAYGTLTGDHARIATILDDVVQSARELAFSRLTEVSQDATATACDGECGESACAAEFGGKFELSAVTLSGALVIGWHTVRMVKCGTCTACIGKRGVAKCDAPTTRDEWLSVGRIIGGALKTASRNALKRDKTEGVEWFSGSASEYGYAEIVSAEMRSHDVDGPVTRTLPADALKIIGKVAAAAELAGESLIAANGAASQFAGNGLALAGGFAMTERGRRSARSALIASADNGKPARTGAPRTRTLSGADRAETRTGTKHGAPVLVFPVTVRGSQDPRTAPKAL